MIKKVLHISKATEARITFYLGRNKHYESLKKTKKNTTIINPFCSNFILVLPTIPPNVYHLFCTCIQ